jgi:acetyl esterase/lipase
VVFGVQVDTGLVPLDALGYLLDTPLAQKITVAGEDCLTINVQRPSTATGGSKLPVLFWIFGGGFELGSTQIYEGTSLILNSIAKGDPVAQPPTKMMGFYAVV